MKSTAWAGKLVVVAGGTGGLGRAVTQAFLDGGATVAVTYRRREELDELTRSRDDGTTRLVGEPLDVTDETAARSWLDGLAARHGRIEAMVNAVGGYAGGARLWDARAGVLDRMLDMNLRSGFALARAVVPIMLRQRQGAIVNVAAKSGLEPPAGAAAYAASKAAAIAMMNALAAEVAGTGVRVNSVLPSIFDTTANRAAMPGADFSKWPKPEDIARVILFLCSDDARVVHGANIPVYGAQ